VNDTYISFYLRANRVHIFVDALRSIGEPKNICFLIDKKGENLVLSPYPKKDFHSHRVSPHVYEGSRSMEVCSMKLCRLLAAAYKWNVDCSYRVPGIIIRQQKIVVFDLRKAEIIDRDDKPISFGRYT
jgi:hypothetical protein